VDLAGVPRNGVGLLSDVLGGRTPKNK